MEQFETIRAHVTRYTHQHPLESQASLNLMTDLALLRMQLRTHHSEEMGYLLRYCRGNALFLDQTLQAAYCFLHLRSPLASAPPVTI